MKLLALFLFIFSVPAWAIKGTYADKQFELPQTCKLRFYVLQGGKALKGLCSASFIGNKTFSSAEHCHDDVARNLTYKIPDQVPEGPWFECPGSSKKYPIKDSFPFKQTGHISHQDIALFKIKEDIPQEVLKPMTLPASNEHIEELLKDPSKCYINGYGLDNDGNYGVLKAAQVVEWDAKPLSFFGGSSFSFKLTKNYADHGDSGGPMYCMDGETPILIGVTHGGMKGLPFSTIEKFSQSMNWVKYVTASELPNNDIYRKFSHTEDSCSSVEECFTKLDVAAKLSVDMKKVIQNLRKDLDTHKEALITGQNLEKKSIEATWDAIIKEWNAHNCFKVLYPD